MGSLNLLPLPIWRVKAGREWLVLVGVVLCLLLLAGCEPSGDRHGDLTPPATPSAQLEQQAIENLVQLYREALLEEDIDRLQELFQPGTVQSQASPQTSRQRQSPDGTFADLSAFRQAMATTFQSRTVTALTLSPDHGDIAPDLLSVSFLEMESTEDPSRLAQQTRVYRTTFELVRTEIGRTVSFRIGAVTRQGPLVLVTTPGRVQAGTLARVTVRDPSSLFALSSGTLRETAAGSEQILHASADALNGTFLVAPETATTTVQIELQNTDGETLSVVHTVRVRQTGDLTVQPVAGTTDIRLQAVAVTRDDTIWAGGDNGASLYRIAAGTTTAELVGQLVSDPTGRIEDLVEDDQGRLHAVIFGQQTSGVVVQAKGVFCQTVNAVDPSYPFRTADGQPSVSTRAIAAGGGAIWLHGSDDGIAQATDDLPLDQCPSDDLSVTYVPILRRQDGLLPSNTVPALLAQPDGTLWVGSALGLARLQNGQLTRVPFDPALSFQGNPETLEAFFQEVTRAIAASKPVDTVAIGDVSFIEAFGAPLIEADLIFSLAQDAQGRLWVGTFGGGVRQITTIDGALQDTLYLTRADGLAGNVVFGLTVAQDGTVWVATDDGVSQLQEIEGTLRMTNYTALDGLTLPARDIAVDASGTVWVATDGGLFRIAPQGGEIAGVVQDTTGQPVVGADVVIFGTPFHAVTDAKGQFSLSHLPAGSYQLLVDGQLATGGPFALTVQEVMVTDSRLVLDLAIVSQGGCGVVIDPELGGQVTFPLVPGAELNMPPQDDTATELTEVCLKFVDATGLPAPLPSGFTAVAAAELQPDGTTFSPPVTLSLPNHAGLPAGQLVVLMRFDDTTQTYEQVGLGRVSVDGIVIDTLSGGLRQFSTVVFVATAADATKVFLVPVSGNNQQVPPGQGALTEPLVVRLEDQFGNPVAGKVVTATIIRGDWTIVDSNLVTDAQGEVSFEAQTGGTGSGADFVAQITAPEVAGVRPVQFLVIVGEADTPDFPIDIAVADGVAYVADRLSGLQVIDVREPSQPKPFATVVFGGEQTGFTSSVALRGDRAYAATSFPPYLNILDNTNLFAPDFPVVLGTIGFSDLLDHAVSGLAVQGDTAYMVTRTLGMGTATLQVIDVREPTSPQLIGTAPVPNTSSGGIFDVTVSGDFVYVLAGSAGLLIFDVRDASNPVRVGILDGPDPTDDIDFIPFSEIAVAGDFVYIVETRRNRTTAQETDHFTVIDVSTPTAPRRRGTLPLQAVPKLILDFGLAVDGPFAYLGRAQFGLVAIDIRDPDAPRMVGIVDTPSQALRVTTDNDFIYVTDTIFGLQVIRGPGPTVTDTDGDGIVDFFDVFPTDASEALDIDGDRLGDEADADDDNDGFTDIEEIEAMPPTDPTDPASFPVGTPPLGSTTLVIDAATSVPVRERNGRPETPYCAVSEALQVLRRGQAPDVDTLLVRAGRYAPQTTGERFPLNFDGLSHLTVQAEEPETAVLDAAFTADVIHTASTTHVVLDGLVLMHGARGIFVKEGTTHTTISNTRIAGNALEGILLGQDVTVGNVIRKNHIENNGNRGIVITGNSAPTVTHNIIRSNVRAGIQVSVSPNATPEIIGNDIKDNDGNGVVLFQSSAMITQNVITGNSSHGILAVVDSTAELVDNTIEDNGRNGVFVNNASFATISGGRITRNGEHGIFVGGGARHLGPSTAGIGLDAGAMIEVTNNQGAGIFVENDGSEAVIDSRQIVFRDNQEGDAVGNVCNVAVVPCP